MDLLTTPDENVYAEVEELHNKDGQIYTYLPYST